MKSACCASIILKYTYLAIFNEYGVPKSSLTRYLRNTYPLLQSSNLNHLQKRVEKGEISRGKVIEILGLTVKMNKSGIPTYLNEHKDLLVVTSADIEGVHPRKKSLRYCREVIKRVNKK